MDRKQLGTLEFDKVTEMLRAHALSGQARARADALQPILNIDLLKVALRETGDARQIVEQQGLPPLSMMEGLADGVRLAAQEGLLSPAQLTQVATFAGSCRRMALYLKKAEETRVELSLNGRALLPLTDLEEQIENAIRGDEVDDAASPRLRDVRRAISAAEEQVKQRLQRMLQTHKDWFSEGFVSIRNGRYTLPVKAQHRQQVPGTVIDKSGSGGTLFIEPASVRAAEDELALKRIEEDNEVRRVLYALSALVAEAGDAVQANMALMARLDFAFAKGKLSIEMDAREAAIAADRTIRIVQGRHPLLDRARVVPLDFEIGGGTRGVVITGPNTGGKTVALKTIGLLCLMAQSGLHVPAGEGSQLCMHNQVLCSIGDGQSIAENLSTFSSHMTQVLKVLKAATRESLVLLDELGSGTDPAEGMGLAVAVLEELSARGCLFVVTTHYPEVKGFAQAAEGMTNARMEFDPDTLSPLFRLILGEAGESCALHIARRLGFPDALIERARRAAYGRAPAAAPAPVARPESSVAREPAPRLSAYDKPVQAPPGAQKYARGDSVRVYPEGVIGIVHQPTDERGMISVQLRNKKQLVPYKRLRLIAPASSMYPDDYDFSIVFDTVANRKARHVMDKRHDPDAVITHE